MDYLRECMNDVGNPPIDAMNQNFCIMCANRGCERAGLNNSAFDRRSKHWKETLFTNVPRAGADDPAFDNIRSKQFSPLGTPASPRTAVFIPGVPTVSPPVQMAAPSAFVRAPAPPEPAPPAAPDAPAPEGAAADPEPAQDPPSLRVPAPGNTAFEQGMVLGGGPPAPAAQPAPDPREPQGGPGTTFILEDD